MLKLGEAAVVRGALLTITTFVLLLGQLSNPNGV